MVLGGTLGWSGGGWVPSPGGDDRHDSWCFVCWVRFGFGFEFGIEFLYLVSFVRGMGNGRDWEGEQ